jgi:hypothetical protein
MRRMRVACSIPKATNTPLEYAKYTILIPFPRQQWLQERASMFCYTYIACLGFTLRQSSKATLCSPCTFSVIWNIITVYKYLWYVMSLNCKVESTANPS